MTYSAKGNTKSKVRCWRKFEKGGKQCRGEGGGGVINTLTTMGAVHVRKSFIDKEPNVVKQLV